MRACFIRYVILFWLSCSACAFSAFKSDSRNRLVGARTKDHLTAAKGFDLTFDYDVEGRRFKKNVAEFANGQLVATRNTIFVWDGWEMSPRANQWHWPCQPIEKLSRNGFSAMNTLWQCKIGMNFGHSRGNLSSPDPVSNPDTLFLRVKFAYIELNTPTPCPPRSAVPVNLGKSHCDA